MELPDVLGFEMLALLFDAPAPVSVVFPEARTFLPETKSVDIDVAFEWLQRASTKGWVALTIQDGSREYWPYRPATHGDLADMASEYRQGLRDSNEIRQILDRVDLWLEISEEGRAAVKAAWSDMPENA